MKYIKLFEEMNESDAPSDELIKGNVYKIYDRKQNGKLIYRAAQFEGPDAQGNKFRLVSFPTEKFEWLKKDEMDNFYLSKIDWKPSTEYKKKK